MKHILEFNEFKGNLLNEATSISTWKDAEIIDLFRQLTDKKSNIYKRFEKEFNKRNLDQALLVKEDLNEAQKYDIEAALRKIREFNRGNYKQFKSGDIEELSADILKDLGLKVTGGNVDEVAYHIGASMVGKDKIPEDRDLVKEIYAIVA